MNYHLITILKSLIAIDKKHDSPICILLAITKQIRFEQHRCLLYNNRTDESYRKNVTESEEKPHYQVGLWVLACSLYVKLHFIWAKGFARVPQSAEQCPWCCHERQSIWPSCSMKLPPFSTSNETFLSKLSNEAEPEVNQL